MSEIASKLIGAVLWRLNWRHRKQFLYLLLRLKEFFGRPPFTAHNDLDKKLLKHLDYENGFFIEVGANDGISQSNTYYFERKLGWRGILIEPMPELYRLCRKFRKSTVVNCALGRFDQEGQHLAMVFSDLMSVVADTSVVVGEKQISAMDHARAGQRFWGGESYTVKAPVRALGNLLREQGVDRIDLFSLDVEGYEKEVLQGMDFGTHRPKYILLETWDIEGVRELLPERYDLIEKFSTHDYLFKYRD